MKMNFKILSGFAAVILTLLMLFPSVSGAITSITGNYKGNLTLTTQACYSTPAKTIFPAVVLSVSSGASKNSFSISIQNAGNVGVLNLPATRKGNVLFVKDSSSVPNFKITFGNQFAQVQESITPVVGYTGACVLIVSGKLKQMASAPVTKPTATPKATATVASSPTPISVLGNYILGPQTANNKTVCAAKAGTLLPPPSFKVLSGINAGYDYYVILGSGQNFNANFKSGVLSLVQIVYPTVSPIISDPGNADPGNPVASPPSNAIRASISIKSSNATLGSGFTLCTGFNNQYFKK